MNWSVYILQCSNGNYYVGHTNDLPSRFHRHQKGQGAKHTSQNTPSDILYSEVFRSELEAIKRERQLKRWSRAKKEALIAGDMDSLRTLSKSRE
jgi:tRNA/rRNA methyltransferase